MPLDQALFPVPGKAECRSWDGLCGKPEIRERLHVWDTKPVGSTVFIHRPPTGILRSMFPVNVWHGRNPITFVNPS